LPVRETMKSKLAAIIIAALLTGTAIAGTRWVQNPHTGKQDAVGGAARDIDYKTSKYPSVSTVQSALDVVMENLSGAGGPAGPGVAAGGGTGQVLRKATAADYDTEWYTPSYTTNWGAIVGTLSDQSDLWTALQGREPANSNIQGHIATVGNPHSTTAAQVGAEPVLGYPSVDYDCLKRQTSGSGVVGHGLLAPAAVEAAAQQG